MYIQGVPKKCDQRVNALRGIKKLAKDESWVSFEKFRKCLFEPSGDGHKLKFMTVDFYAGHAGSFLADRQEIYTSVSASAF